MSPRHLRLLAVAAMVAAGIAAPLVLRAQSSPISANPRFTPIGVSAAGAHSAVWFHEPVSGRVMVCQTSGTTSGPGAIHCSSAQLP